MKVLYPGSFDPITNGHVDVIKRISKLFDEIVIAVLINPEKTCFIPYEDRIQLIKESTGDVKNLRIEGFKGLTVEYAKSQDVNVIVRGLRCATDFGYELEMSQINYFLSKGIDTIYLMTNPKYSFIRSSRVKEVATLGGDIKDLVPKAVFDYLSKSLTVKK